MRTVEQGDTITFTVNFIDGLGDPYDPPEVLFRIAKNATTFLSDTFSLSAGDVTTPGLGTFSYIYQTTIIATPGVYNARWDADIEGNPSVVLESFQIVEPQPVPNAMVDAPRRYGVMMESALYRTLGVGETDRLFIIGHADSLEINDPYQVTDMQEAINFLGGHSESPMVRALLEAYNAGARDMWLVASAPEGEYVPYDFNDDEVRFVERAEWAGKNFYEQYYDRLQITLDLLLDFDLPEIITAVDAPMFDTRGVDFLTQLTDHCLESYEITSAPRIGIIGTRMGNFDADLVQGLIDDTRLDDDFGDSGKFVVIAAGEGVFSLIQMPTSHVSPINVVAAGQLSASPMNAGLTYKILKNVQAPYGRAFTKNEYKALASRKVNPLIRTTQGRRGNPFQSVLATDNTLAAEGSDYWSIVQMRLVSKVIQEVRVLGGRALGTIGFLQFKADVASYLNRLVMAQQIKRFSLDIQRDREDLYKANVDISLTPYFGVREISFQVQVGPGV